MITEKGLLSRGWVGAGDSHACPNPRGVVRACRGALIALGRRELLGKGVWLPTSTRPLSPAVLHHEPRAIGHHTGLRGEWTNLDSIPCSQKHHSDPKITHRPQVAEAGRELSAKGAHPSQVDLMESSGGEPSGVNMIILRRGGCCTSTSYLLPSQQVIRVPFRGK